MIELRLELERTRRDVERARMGAEDIRSASISPYPMLMNTYHGDALYRLQTWREFAVFQREELINQGVELIGSISNSADAVETLMSASLVAFNAFGDPHANFQSALDDARNSMIDAIHQLEGSDDNDADDDLDNEDMDIDDLGSDAGDASAMVSTGVSSTDEGHSSQSESDDV